jgi:hypothetical protein
VKKGGYDKVKKHKVPDEWLVLEHADFIKKHPRTCPPNHFPEHPDETGIAVESDSERAWRFLGLQKMFAPVVDVLERLTPEERAAIEENLTVEPCEPEDRHFAGITREQILEHLRKLRNQVPIGRGQTKSLSVGNDQVPTEVTTKALSVSHPSPYGSNDQVPTDRETSSNTPVKTPPTTPTTSPAKGVEGEVERRSEKSKPQSTSSVSSAIDATSLRGDRAAQARADLHRWIEKVFTEADKGNEWNVRKGVGKSDGVYHDDWADLDRHVEEYGEHLVKVAWTAFVKLDDLPTGWKFHLMKFNSDFYQYLRKAEVEKCGKSLAKEVQRVRSEIYFWTLGDAGQFKEFTDTLTLEDIRAIDNRRDFFSRNKNDENYGALKFDLGQAGPLLRLKRRAEDWANSPTGKELIAKRNKEIREWEERECVENPNPDLDEDFEESKRNRNSES